MRRPLLAAVLIAGTIALPPAAIAQGTTTGSTAKQSSVDNQITSDQRSNFRSYVTEQKTPSYTIPGSVQVGVTLPDPGVTYYDVPERFAATTYRYTVVNDRVVLVDPTTRRVVQVVD